MELSFAFDVGFVGILYHRAYVEGKAEAFPSFSIDFDSARYLWLDMDRRPDA